jgi:DegV family protein with EDD domain
MVHIITDTTACLPAEFTRKHSIPIIPQIVTFGEDSYYEGIDIDNEGFLKRLTTASELPKTAAPPPELFCQEFQKLVASDESIICIHPSSEVSGTVRSASVAAKDFPGIDIRVIDSRTVAAPLAQMVQMAVLWSEAGETADRIEQRLKDLIPRSRIYFLVDTLEYLAKGGRIGGASALLGSVLQIKPILTIRGGRVESYEKERTHKRALARLVDITLEQFTPSDVTPLMIMHADSPDEAQVLANEFFTRLGITDIPIYPLPPAIVVHGGPGVLGVSFFVNDEKL